MPRFAANISLLFTEHPFLDRFRAAADAGFDAAEYLFPYEFPADLLARALAEAGLKQVLFNMPPGNWDKGERGLAALTDRKDEFRRGVATAIAYAKATGTPLLHMMAGNAPVDDAAAFASYRDALAFAADEAGAAGIGVTIEPINSRDMPDYFLNDFYLAAEIIDTLGRRNVRLQFDVYHRQIMNGDVLTGLAALMPMIGHVQTASVPRRQEPMTGELDDARIFSALDELRYEGYVGCEYRPAGNTVAGLEWLHKWRAVRGRD